MCIKVIAEAGVNHNGSMDMAIALVDAAAEAGADIVKFQTFQASRLVEKNAPKANYQRVTTDSSESHYDMLKKLELSQEIHYVLLEHCRSRGIEFLSSPFDIDSLNFLSDDLGLDTIKLGSGEITNGPLLLAAARKGLSIILSSGMSVLGEIEEALSCLAFGYLNSDDKPSREKFYEAFSSTKGQEFLREKIVLLHCTTEYPAPLEDVNLRTLSTMANAFKLRVGYSDHTEGISIPTAAVAMGASVIEKHFTLDKKLPGPDHQASLEPKELACMISGIRAVEKALGSGVKTIASSESKNRDLVRKSLRASRSLPENKTLVPEDIAVMRPGGGRSPMDYWNILGTKISKNYSAGEKI